MRVFLSYSVSPDDGPVAARIKAVAAAYGITVVLPNPVSRYMKNNITQEARKAIRSCDVVVVLATEGATRTHQVGIEMREALRLGKPVVALLEDAVDLGVEQGVHAVRFDRDDPTAHEGELMAALRALKDHLHRQKVKSENAAAVGWLAAVAVGLVGLGVLAAILAGSDDDD